MKLKAHPRYSEFKAWFTAHAHDARPLDDMLYRIAGPRYTTAADIVSGIGAFKAGGRWNPPGVMKVVYLSRAPETALFEANAHHRHFMLPLWEGMPKVVVAVRITARSVLDLTDAAVASSLPEPIFNIMAEDWRAVMARNEEPTSQAIGRAAWKAKLSGLIVPSNPDPTGQNMVIFPTSLKPPDGLEVQNPRELESLGRPT